MKTVSMIVCAILLSGVGCFAGETAIQYIYFGTTHCGFCENPEVVQAIRDSMSEVEKAAVSRGWTFQSTIVSLDRVEADAKQFFEKNAPQRFDRTVWESSDEIDEEGRKIGHEFQTREFQHWVIELPDGLLGTPINALGIPYVVIARIAHGSETVLAKYLGSSLVILGDYKKEEPLACLLDHDCHWDDTE